MSDAISQELRATREELKLAITRLDEAKMTLEAEASESGTTFAEMLIGEARNECAAALDRITRMAFDALSP